MDGEAQMKRRDVLPRGNRHAGAGARKSVARRWTGATGCTRRLMRWG